MLFAKFLKCWKLTHIKNSIFNTTTKLKCHKLKYFGLTANRVYKFKRKRKNYVKSKQSGFRILYYKIWRILKIDWSSFFKTMNENDFNYFDAITRFKAYQAQRRYRKLFLFFFFLKKNNWNLTEVTGNCSEVCFGLEIWGVLDSTKSGHIDKIRCSVKRLPSCMGYWRVLDYNVEGKLQATWQNKIRYSGKDLRIFLG